MIKGYRLQVVGCSILIFVLLSTVSCCLLPISAAESSQSATQSADIKSKLKILQEEIASRAAGMKNEVTKKLQNKAYVGMVKSKNSSGIILISKNNEKNVAVNEYTEYVIKSKKSIGDAGLKNITTDSTVACLGDIDDKGILTAKRIVKLSSPLPAPETITHGIITQISNGIASLQTAQKDKFSISFDKNTEYQIGKSGGSFDDIRANKWVIVKGESTNSAAIKASYVYIFPNAITVKSKPASPSATPVKK